MILHCPQVFTQTIKKAGVMKLPHKQSGVTYDTIHMFIFLYIIFICELGYPILP